MPSSRHLAVDLAEALFAFAAYQVSVRMYAAATPTSCVVLATVTCRPVFAAGVPPLKLAAGWPVQFRSDGNAYDVPEQVVWPTAQATHLSRIVLALASPVTQ